MLFARRPIQGVDLWVHRVALRPLQKRKCPVMEACFVSAERGSYETNRHFILSLFVFYFVESLKEEPYFIIGRFDP